MKKYKKNIIPILFLVFLITVLTFLIINIKDREENKHTPITNVPATNKGESNVITKKSYKNLMIVAHPDDETLWGGAHLLEDDYVVVCVTCGGSSLGGSEIRAEEFKKAMEITKDEYIMLGYPDIVDGKISNWKYVYSSIENNLKNIIEDGNYEKIVTHNPDGEYGHMQHKMVSKMVTNNVDTEKLYYFGHFYKKNQKIPENSKKISKESYNVKVSQLIKVYPSQRATINLYLHMLEYENWIKYSEWDVKI